MTPDEQEVKAGLTDKQLDVLHDHYKDTFARLRESEQRRDRVFIWLIVLFALLILEVGYPATVSESLGTLSLAGGEIDLEGLPLPALLNASWVLTLVVGLQYCQATVRVNRQYPYLHMLEDTISPEVGGGTIYRREGKIYLEDYPLLLDVAWFAYGILFPFAVLVACIWLLYVEWTELPYPVAHLIVDTVAASALVGVFFIYRVQPAISRKLQEQQEASG